MIESSWNNSRQIYQMVVHVIEQQQHKNNWTLTTENIFDLKSLLVPDMFPPNTVHHLTFI